MRERVELANGTFMVHSAPGRGTTVLASLPSTPCPRRAVRGQRRNLSGRRRNDRPQSGPARAFVGPVGGGGVSVGVGDGLGPGEGLGSGSGSGDGLGSGSGEGLGDGDGAGNGTWVSGPRCSLERRRREVLHRGALERRRHEVVPDQRGDRPAEHRVVALDALEQDLALRVAHPDAGRELRVYPQNQASQ